MHIEQNINLFMFFLFIDCMNEHEAQSWEQSANKEGEVQKQQRKINKIIL